MTIDRRLMLTGLASAAATPALAAEPAERWIAYEARLRARIADAGGGRFDRAFAAELMNRNNELRRAQTLAPLIEDEELTRAAQAHAADMIARRYFAHPSPEGFDPGDRAGLLVRRSMGAFGENIAYQRGGTATAQAIYAGWRDSPHHRENMLRPQFTHVGHGVARLESTWQCVAVFCEQNGLLAAPLPLGPSGADLRQAMSTVAPPMAGYRFSEPDGPAIDPTYSTSGPSPAPRPGAWRLRALKPQSDRRFDVLWGPIFVA